jgi:hypothetical protein
MNHRHTETVNRDSGLTGVMPVGSIVWLGRFQDQLEAAQPEQNFWHSFRNGKAPVSLEGHPHRGEGGSTTLIYLGSELVGVSTISRDPMNWTVLVCVDLRPNIRS